MQGRITLGEIKAEQRTTLKELQEMATPLVDLSEEFKELAHDEELTLIKAEAKELQNTLFETGLKFQHELSGVLCKLEEEFANESFDAAELAAQEKLKDEENRKKWQIIQSTLLKTTVATPLLTFDLLANQLTTPRSFDRLLACLNQELKNEKNVKNFQKLLKKPSRKDNDNTVYVSDYVQLIQDRNSKKYLLTLTREGEELRDYAFHEERMEQLNMAHLAALNLLQDNVLQQKQTLQILHHKVTACVAKFIEKKQAIHAEKSKPVIQEIKQHRKATKHLLFTINKYQNEIQRLRLAKLALGTAQTELDKLENLAGEMELTILEANQSVNVLEAKHLVSGAKHLLDQTKHFGSRGKWDYGTSKTWDRVAEKIKNQSQVLFESITTFQQFLQSLRQDKAVLDDQVAQMKKAIPPIPHFIPTVVIEEENRVEKSLEEIEVLPDPSSDEDAVQCYLLKTDQYLEDLSHDMKMRLVDLQESAANDYAALVKILKLPEDADVAQTLDRLEKLYDIKNNNDETLRKARIQEILLKKTVAQAPLQAALHKHQLMTILKGQLQAQKTYQERRQDFVNTLSLKKNVDLLDKHRDWSFYAFIRGCGKAVAAIFGVGKKSSKNASHKMHYDGLFSPRSRQYANSIKKEEQARNAKRLDEENRILKRTPTM